MTREHCETNTLISELRRHGENLKPLLKLMSAWGTKRPIRNPESAAGYSEDFRDDPADAGIFSRILAS